MNIEFNPYIIFHWGNFNIGTEIWNKYIIPWINVYPQTIIYITCHKKYFNDIELFLNPMLIFTDDISGPISVFDNYIYIFDVPNIGMDIGPFFMCINKLLKSMIQADFNKITFIKIHTKSIKSWRDDLISKLLDPTYNISNWQQIKIGSMIPAKYKYKLDNLNAPTIKKILNDINKSYIFDNKYDYTTLPPITTESSQELSAQAEPLEDSSFKEEPFQNDSFQEEPFVDSSFQKEQIQDDSVQEEPFDNTFDYEFYQKYNNINLYYDNPNDNKIFLDYHWKNIGKYKNLPFNKNNIIQVSTNNKRITKNIPKIKALPVTKFSYNIITPTYNITKQTEYYFSAGTMFWIKGDIIYNFFTSFDIEYQYSLMESGYTLNDKPTMVHAWERILSLIPYFYDRIIIDY